jgi:peroxiredoxin
MKKIISLFLIAGVIFLISCGGKENKKSKDKIKTRHSTETTKNDEVKEASVGQNTSISSQGEKLPENPGYKTSPAVIKGYLTNGVGLNIIVDMLPSAGDIVPLTSINVDENSYFEANVLVTEPSIYQLRLGHANIHMFLRGGENVEIIADINNVGDYKITGSKESEQLREMYILLNQYNHRVSEVQDRFEYLKLHAKENYKLKQEMFNMYDSMDFYYAQIAKEKSEAMRNFITRIDTSMISLLAAMKLNRDEDYDFLKNILDKFEPAHRHSSYYKDLANKVDKMIPVFAGKEAPEISMDDPNGNTITLSKLRGNPVIIYFWASFDELSPETNKQLLNVYNKYKAKGLKVMAISVDDENTRDNWIKAIDDQNLDWLNVSNLYGWDDEVVSNIYKINKVPYFIVLDRKGIIKHKGELVKDIEPVVQELY